jgi:hypothetical protein
MPQPRKVFLFALPRSGSTLLCDLLTIPGRSVILHEPMVLRNFGDGRQQRVIRTLAALGITVDDDHGQFVPGQPARSWFQQHVFPRLQDYDFWGLKEVYLTDAQQLIDTYRPDQILLLWRDPKDVALSFLELMNRALMSYGDRTTLKDEAWALECLTVSAEVLAEIAATRPHLLVRYEQMMTSPQHRQQLLDFVGLEKFGDQRFAMIDDRGGVRTTEIERHQRTFSANSLHRYDAEPPGWRRTFARVCHWQMGRAAAAAGYPAVDPPAQPVCARPAGSQLQRVFAPDYQPAPEFDFAYARRRGRRRIASLLGPHQAVLDVGASTAALAFMVDAQVTVVDDGAPGQRILSKPWREGVFPTLDRFDTVTFVSSLEHVEDPRLMVSRLLARGLRIILTYHCRDDLAADRRSALEFRSHLSRSDWQSFAGSVAAPATYHWAFDGFQSLICFQPPDVTGSTATGKREVDR